MDHQRRIGLYITDSYLERYENMQYQLTEQEYIHNCINICFLSLKLLQEIKRLPEKVCKQMKEFKFSIVLRNKYIFTSIYLHVYIFKHYASLENLKTPFKVYKQMLKWKRQSKRSSCYMPKISEADQAWILYVWSLAENLSHKFSFL